MQNKYYTHEQFQTQILDKRPVGAEIKDIVDTFVSNGYTIEGVNAPEKPIESKQPGFLDRLKESISGGVEGVKQADAAYYKSNQENALLGQQATDAIGVLGAVGKGIAGVGSTLINSIPGVEPAMNAITSTAKSGLEAYDKNIIQPAGQAIRGAIGSENVDAVAKQADPAAQAVLDYANQPNVQKNIESVKGIAEGALTLAGAKSLTKGAVGTTKVVGKTIFEGLENLAQSSKVTRAEIKSALSQGAKGEEIAASLLTKQNKLNPSDRRTFMEISGGLDDGQYLVKKGIFETPEESVNALAKDWAESYNLKKEKLKQLPDQYTFSPVNEALKDLVAFDKKTSVPGAPGVFTKRISELANAAKTRGLTINEIDDVKNIYENTAKMGYNKMTSPESVQRATNIDNALREFVEEKATAQGFTNVKELNKNTQLSRFLADAIEKRVSGSAGNNFLSLTDTIIGAGVVVDPSALLVLAGKKLAGSESLRAYAAKKLAGTTKKDLEAKMSQSTPALLNPADTTVKTDFFVAPKGSKPGQFESSTKKVINGSSNNQGIIQPIKEKVIVSSKTDIPQSKKITSGKVKTFTNETSIPKELQPLAEEAKKYKSAEEFVKAKMQTNKSFNTPEIETEISVKDVKHESLGKQNLSDSTVKSTVKKGRKITEPIEAEFNVWDNSWRVGDGQHRIEQAIANGDKTIPARVRYVDKKWNKNSAGTYTSMISEEDLTKQKLIDIWSKTSKR